MWNTLHNAFLALALIVAGMRPALAQNANAQCTKEIETQATIGLSGTLTFLDACGTQSNTFEMVVTGAPATVTVTINGVQPGGTATALASSTSTTNTNLFTTGGPFTKYQIAYTITGGTSPVLTFNRTGSSQSARAGAYVGVPNAATVGGNNHIYRGVDVCDTASKAQIGESTGNIFLYGFKGTQICAPSTVNALINSGFTGHLWFDCSVIVYLPLVSAGAASQPNPRLGVLVEPPSVRLHGCQTSGSAGAVTTVFKACPSSGGPSGCTAPQTASWAITSTTVTFAGNRTFLGFTVSGADVQGRDPIRIQNYQNVANNSFALTACQPAQTANGRVDPNCPAYPTSTLIYAPVNSGVWSASIGAGGAGYSGTLTWLATGGGCNVEPSGGATQSGGVVNAVFIQNRGRGCTSAPSANVVGSGGGAGGTVTFTIATACASNCGTLHSEIPLLETGAFGNNTFSQGADWISFSCSNVPDCIGLRSLTANEQGEFNNLFFTQFQERCIDFHLFRMQNANALRGIRCNGGPSSAGDIGTEAIYIGDSGPHGIVDFTGDFSSAATPVADCVRIDADFSLLYVQGGHCENALYGILVGSGNPTRGIRISDWAGAPQSVSITTGEYQTEVQSAVKIRSEYYTNSSPITTVITADYGLSNIIRNSATAGASTIVDDNPIGASAQGYDITDIVTELYDVDQGSNGCTNVVTSSVFGNYTNCNIWNLTGVAPQTAAIATLAAKCNTGVEGWQAQANNCNAACVAGNACTGGGATHCQMYCNSAGTLVETGR